MILYYSSIFLFRGSKLPPFVHKSIMNEFSRLQNMHPSSPDYSLALNYINYVVNLPWNKNTIETLDFEKAKKVGVYLFINFIYSSLK